MMDEALEPDPPSKAALALRILLSICSGVSRGALRPLQIIWVLANQKTLNLLPAHNWAK
jgi:hypothetical protein